MQSFTSADFIEMQQKASIELSDEGWQRESHLGKVINIHLLGAYMQQGYTVPPLGVELMCRVEVKVIDFKHKVGDTDTVIGVKKPRQEQQIWTLRHTGHTWSLHHVEVADGDITHLKEYDPLPAIIEWKKEDTTTS